MNVALTLVFFISAYCQPQITCTQLVLFYEIFQMVN